MEIAFHVSAVTKDSYVPRYHLVLLQQPLPSLMLYSHAINYISVEWELA